MLLRSAECRVHMDGHGHAHSPERYLLDNIGQ